METKTCNRCNTEKTIDNFSPASVSKGKQYYRGECKECNRAIQKMPGPKAAQKRYKSSPKGKATRKLSRNSERENELARLKYQTDEEHRQKKITKSINQINKKLEADPVYRTIFYLKNRLRDWVKIKGERKNSEIGNYVGCTKNEFKVHIEKQFQPGMTWDNHGEWELDHIIPISSAETMEEAYKLTHYTNFQPLWKPINREKSNKISKEYNNEQN